MPNSRASLPLKFGALLHAMMLIAGQGEPLEMFIKSIHSWVTDYGTEVGIADIRRIALESVLPYLDSVVVDRDTAMEVDFAEEVAGLPAQEPQADIEGSFSIPGVLHIIRNAWGDLANCMDC